MVARPSSLKQCLSMHIVASLSIEAVTCSMHIFRHQDLSIVVAKGVPLGSNLTCTYPPIKDMSDVMSCGGIMGF